MNQCISCKYATACADYSRAEVCEGYERITMQAYPIIADKIADLRAMKEEKEKTAAGLMDEYQDAANAWEKARRAGGSGEDLRETMEYYKEYAADKYTEAAAIDEYIAVYRANQAVSLINALVLPEVIRVFNKYNGKRYGEKTRAKISDEIHAATGCRVWIRQESYDRPDALQVNFPGRDYRDETLYTRYDTEKKERPLLLVDNVIQGDAFADLVPTPGPGRYVADVAGYVQARKDLREEVEQARAELERAAKAYNDVEMVRENHIKTYFPIKR